MGLFFLLCFFIAFMESVYPANSSKNIKLYVAIVFFIFAILIGLRNPSVGDDTSVYIRNFNLVRKYESLSKIASNSRFEIGYLFYVKLLTLITDDPQILLVVTAVFVSYAFGRFIYRYSNNPMLSILMFLTLDYFDTCMSSVRISMAIAFLLFAYDGLFERNLLKTLFFTLAAASMHYTAIVFLVLYPITAKRRGIWFHLISVAIVIVLSMTFNRVVQFVGSYLPQYTHYFENSTTGYTAGATLAIGLMIVLWLAMYLFSTLGIKLFSTEKVNPCKYIKQREIEEDSADLRPCNTCADQVDNVCRAAVWMGVLALLLALNGTMLARFKYIFSASILLLFPNSIIQISNDSNQKFFLLGSALLFVAYTIVIVVFRPTWSSTYPYSFFWQ